MSPPRARRRARASTTRRKLSTLSRESVDNFRRVVDLLGEKQAATGIKLLWGTANVFSHRRFMSGAATNPNPEIYALAALQVKEAMDATKRLGGANYVLWGGREGYETLLNTDLARESKQYGRFLQMAVEHKHKIGLEGYVLIEPKPREPTKHQYDYDVATVHGFLRQYGLENEVKVNIEANHATLSGTASNTRSPPPSRSACSARST
jgi:xylose isomerase